MRQPRIRSPSGVRAALLYVSGRTVYASLPIFEVTRHAMCSFAFAISMGECVRIPGFADSSMKNSNLKFSFSVINIRLFV